MPRLTVVKQGFHLLHRRWPVAKISTGGRPHTVIHQAKLKDVKKQR